MHINMSNHGTIFAALHSVPVDVSTFIVAVSPVI